MMNHGFSHRFNAGDGTVDSICHRCFKTVAIATREADLEIPEQKHTCDPEAELRYDLRAEAAKLMRPN